MPSIRVSCRLWENAADPQPPQQRRRRVSLILLRLPVRQPTRTVPSLPPGRPLRGCHQTRRGRRGDGPRDPHRVRRYARACRFGGGDLVQREGPSANTQVRLDYACSCTPTPQVYVFALLPSLASLAFLPFPLGLPPESLNRLCPSAGRTTTTNRISSFTSTGWTRP